MPRRWREPGSERWVKIVAWALLIAVVGYGAYRLASALNRRFGAIRRSYQVPEVPRGVSGRHGPSSAAPQACPFALAVPARNAATGVRIGAPPPSRQAPTGGMTFLSGEG